MQASYLLAAPYADRKRLEWLDSADAPIVVYGVLSRLLAAQSGCEALKMTIAQHLRQTTTHTWLASADLAEICAALDGMHAYDPKLVTGTDIAALVQRLLTAELVVGGPYAGRTGQADPFTNAYVAQCMGWLASPLPNVLRYLADAMPDLSDIELADWPMAAAIQMMLAADDVSYIQELLSCYDEIVAALALSITDSLTQHLRHEISSADVSAEDMHELCRRALRHLQQPLQAKTRMMVDQVIRSDTDHEISKLAWYYGSGLTQPPRAIDKKLCLQLGTANLYAWAAYSIYDDFLDDEGQPDMLGTANFSFRSMLGLYRQILPDVPGFQEFVESSLTAVDQANALEVSDFRFSSSGGVLRVGVMPDFGGCEMLADRALFHILGPMAVLAGSGINVGDPQWNSTLNGFRHYLIARQLNDDIHDWQKDLAAGQTTYVVVELLRHMGIQPGVYVLNQLMPHARQQFWQYVLPGICDAASEHLTAARHDLRNGLALAPDSHIPRLLTSIQLSMQAAKVQRSDARALIRSFGIGKTGNYSGLADA